MKSTFAIGFGAILLSAAALAAGPFDGSWVGESPPVGRRCPPNTVMTTITDGKLTGSYQVGLYKFPIKGTVQPDGTLVGGFMANLPLTGKFSGNQFDGVYTSKECNSPRRVTMHRG